MTKMICEAAKDGRCDDDECVDFTEHDPDGRCGEGCLVIGVTCVPVEPEHPYDKLRASVIRMGGFHPDDPSALAVLVEAMRYMKLGPLSVALAKYIDDEVTGENDPTRTCKTCLYERLRPGAQPCRGCWGVAAPGWAPKGVEPKGVWVDESGSLHDCDCCEHEFKPAFEPFTVPETFVGSERGARDLIREIEDGIRAQGV